MFLLFFHTHFYCLNGFPGIIHLHNSALGLNHCDFCSSKKKADVVFPQSQFYCLNGFPCIIHLHNSALVLNHCDFCPSKTAMLMLLFFHCHSSTVYLLKHQFLIKILIWDKCSCRVNIAIGYM